MCAICKKEDLGESGGRLRCDIEYRTASRNVVLDVVVDFADSDVLFARGDPDGRFCWIGGKIDGLESLGCFCNNPLLIIPFSATGFKRGNCSFKNRLLIFDVPSDVILVIKNNSDDGKKMKTKVFIVKQ